MRVVTEQRARIESERSGRTQAELWPIGVVLESRQSRPVFLLPSGDAQGGDRIARDGRAEVRGRAIQPGRTSSPSSPQQEPSGTIVRFVDGAGDNALGQLRGFSTGTPAIVAHVVGAQVGAWSGAHKDSEAGGRRDAAPVTVAVETSAAELTAATVTIRHPELGRVELGVKVDGRDISIRVRATESAHRALSSSREDLDKTLSEQGFALISWEVDDPQVRTAKPARASHHKLDMEV